jgi:nucleoside phosphorylase
MELRVLILTPLELEYQAIARHIPSRTQETQEGTAFERGAFAGQHHQYQVVLCRTGMKIADMALATEQAVRLYQPHIALLCGVAAGIKEDARIGDVVAGTKAYGYEGGKEDEHGFHARPEVGHFSRELLAQAEHIGRSGAWKQRSPDNAPNARLLLGPIVSGNKVLASRDNAAYQAIRRHYNDSLALEMEAIGFAQALQKHPEIHALNIRGISDVCAGKNETDDQNWQPVAAARAAAVAIELLYQLKELTLLQPVPMNSKEIAQKTYQLFFPTTASELLADFLHSENAQKRALWLKVKPLCVQEALVLANEPNDEDNQAAVRLALKKAFDSDAGLKQEITDMLNTLPASAGTTIVNSKNVISGSTIHVGGNFHLGDHTT